MTNFKPITAGERLLDFLDGRGETSQLQDIMTALPDMNKTTLKWTLNNILVKKMGYAIRIRRGEFIISPSGQQEINRLKGLNPQGQMSLLSAEPVSSIKITKTESPRSPTIKGDAGDTLKLFRIIDKLGVEFVEQSLAYYKERFKSEDDTKESRS